LTLRFSISERPKACPFSHELKDWTLVLKVDNFFKKRTKEKMVTTKPKDPLHGMTLEKILTELVDHYGWEAFSKDIKLNCFSNDPSIKSSLKFLRRTGWARDKVEKAYIKYLKLKNNE
jgi:hypothetical protein